MGSLLPMEDCEIYGYVTSSNVKFLALIRRDAIIALEKRKESDIRTLLVSMDTMLISFIPINQFQKFLISFSPMNSSMLLSSSQVSMIVM